MEKLNELAELANKATKGAWVADSGEGWDAIISQQDMVNSNFIIGEFIGPDSAVNKDFVLAASPENILAIAEAFRELEQRAEAAEAKLAELEKEEPKLAYIRRIESELAQLRTRPAPAINLAELVPGECIPAHYTFSGEQEGEEHPRYAEGFNACRAAILRKIEETK